MNESQEALLAESKAKNERDLEATKQMRAFTKLLRYIKGYIPQMVLAWVFVAIEVLCEILIPFFTANIITIIQDYDVSHTFDWGGLWIWSGVTIGLAITSCTVGIIAGFFAAEASAGYGRNLRKEMYYKIQDFSFANIDKFSTASLVTRLTTDVTNVQFSVQMILRLVVRSPMMLIFALIMAAITEWRLSLIFLGVLPVLAIVLFGITAIVHPTFVKVFNAYDDLNAAVQENLNGIRVVKYFGRESAEIEKFSTVSRFIYRSFVHAEKIIAFNSPAMQLSMYAVTILVSYFGALLVVSNAEGHVIGGLGIPEMTQMFAYAMQILSSLMMLSVGFVMITISRNSAERIYAVFLEKPSIVSPENPVMEVPDGSVDFDHLSFRYFVDADKNVLDDIDLHIPSGATVGVIGGTGSSKTSLISMIARLYDATEGAIKVGGHDVKDYDLHVLRDAVAVVLQKNVLFTGTIRSNLLWGNENATDEELKHACHLACADEFINKFPQGYDSPIEEGGTNVSGGQKQRLCIARALLKKPKILILDDSTSAVDTHTDALIRASFAQEIPNVTKFIVAQRLLSIKDCDIILVLDDGKIVAKGTSDELMKSSPIYQEIYETQLGGGDFDAQN